MYIPSAPLIIGVVSWFFFVLACDPKSKYAFLGAAALMLAICCFFYPQLQPAMARR